MNDLLLKLLVKLHGCVRREDGQDLVEYAFVVALVSFGAVASLKSLSTGISNEFTNISSTLASNLS